VHGIAIAQPGEGRVGIARHRGRFQVEIGAHGPERTTPRGVSGPAEGPFDGLERAIRGSLRRS
jgi:hypothetical protein